MKHFARKIHVKSDDLSNELVELKLNGNTIVAYLWVSFMEKIIIIQKACHPFRTFNRKQFFFFKNHQYVQTTASISHKRGTWKFNRQFIWRKIFKPLFVHRVYTDNRHTQSLCLNSVIIGMVISLLSLPFSLFLFLASPSFWPLPLSGSYLCLLWN